MIINSEHKLEVQGLSTIAVLAYVFYNSQIILFDEQLFKGGFIGIDILFVLTGYLITLSIYKELTIKGYFSFKIFFYQIIMRQVLPILILVIIISFPLGWFYLLPNDFVIFSSSAITSLSFISNLIFYYSGSAFWNISVMSKPLFHTASLSILIQFIILFPLIFIGLYKYLKSYLIFIFCFGFIISLGLAEYSSRNHPSLNFYILPTRVWEFLIGSILAHYETKRIKKIENNLVSLFFSIIGIFLIIYSFFSFNNKILYPSSLILIPLIGVCLIIWFSNNANFITKIISANLFVKTGIFSYSLFLWHYPIFSFSRISSIDESRIFIKLLILLIIVILSIITYYFLQRPLNNREKNNSKSTVFIILIFFLLSAIINLIVIKNNGFKNRVPKILQNSIEKPWNLLKNVDGESCYGVIKCKFNTSSNKKVFIVGDSHMASITFDLKNKIIEKNYQFITSTTVGGCLYFPGFSLANLKNKKQTHEACNFEYFKNLKEILSKQKDSIIIFGGRFPLYISNFFFDNKEGGKEKDNNNLKWPSTYVSNSNYKTIQESFKREVSKLSYNNKIILVYPIPEVGWNIHNEVLSQWIDSNFSKEFNLKFITTSYEIYKDRSKLSFNLLDSIKGENIFRVYPHTIFCDKLIKNRCVTHDDKNIFYSDSNHPSVVGAKLINELIINQIEKIEKSLNYK